MTKQEESDAGNKESEGFLCLTAGPQIERSLLLKFVVNNWFRKAVNHTHTHTHTHTHITTSLSLSLCMSPSAFICVCHHASTPLFPCFSVCTYLFLSV